MAGVGAALLAGMFATYGWMEAPAGRIAEGGVDVLRPAKDDRQLSTTNLQVMLREKTGQSWPFQLRVGVMATHATGHITQLTGSWEAGTLRSVTLDSPGNGIGPVVEASVPLLRGSGGAASLKLDLLAGLLVYDRAFPAGGMRYNGTFQAGPSLWLRLSPQDQLGIGARVTHTSNGRGLGPDNPGYNSRGVTLRWRHDF